MQKLVIVGGGHAAAQLIRTLHKRGFDGEIALITEEAVLPYNRPLLSKDYLFGEVGEAQLPLLPAAIYDKLGVQVHLSSRVEEVDRNCRSVRLQDGQQLPYDQLVLATGANPRQLDVPGCQLEGIHYLKTLNDARRLQESFEPGQHLSVIGGGYIGLEIASAARKLGLEVDLLERGERILGRVVAPEVAGYFHTLHEDQGVGIRTETQVAEFLGDGHVTGVRLESGECLPTDHVVIGIGVEPAEQLALAAGIKCDNGILIDANCQTSDAAIYALGDCARQYHPHYQRWLRLESVQNCTSQAAMLASALLNADTPAPEVPWFWSSQFDRRLQIAGLNTGYTQVIQRGTEADCSWLYLQDGQLIACDAINRPADFLQAKKLIASRARLNPEQARDLSRPLTECIC